MTANPLLDTEFLRQLYTTYDREIFARITALTLGETPTEQIEGRVTGGSINVDGTSACRRSCSVSLVAQDVNINEFYWSLNTKFKLEIGLRNKIKPEYDDIIWFKQGIYIITSFNTSLTTNSYTINIQGKDKMCLLDGTVGGSLTALSYDFGTQDYTDENGNLINTPMPIRDIVTEMVHEYAGEPWENIIINDLDDYGVELLQYRGTANNPLYLIFNTERQEVDQMTLDGSFTMYAGDLEYKVSEIEMVGGKYYKLNELFTDTKPTTMAYQKGGKEIYSIIKIVSGQTCGYRITEITYAGDLIAHVGESMTSVLDKIVKMLGPFEYYYDIDGRFIFQEKPQYLIRSFNHHAGIQTDDSYVENNAYTTPIVWDFNNSTLITSFNNSPDLGNLKNDYSIWGTRQSTTGNELPVHLRYAVDKKPKYYKTFRGKIYLTEKEYTRRAAWETSHFIKGNGSNLFRKSHVAEGLDEEWWDIFDWIRRYMYLADSENTHDINYYLALTKTDISQILSTIQSTNSYNPINPYPLGTFEYYLFILKNVRLGYQGVSATWGTCDYAKIFDLNNPGSYNSYGSTIKRYLDREQTPWTWLMDTYVYHNEDGTTSEVIKSLEHGTAGTGSPSIYPTSSPSCSHVFREFITRANSYGEDYHVYIHGAEIPISLKDEDTVKDKIDLIDKLSESNYEVVDWRELIYQMAIDYRRFNHCDDFLVKLRDNNGVDLDGSYIYPKGKTGYEQYYIDMEGFWRQLYCPEDDKTSITLSETQYMNAEPGQYYIKYWDTRDENYYKAKWYYKDITEPEKGYYDSATGEVRTVNSEYNITNIYYYTPTNWENGWNPDIENNPESLNFWFDFMDDGGSMEKYSASYVGDRPKSINDSMIKSIYFRETPTIIFGNNISNIDKKLGYCYMQYNSSMASLFTMSAQGKDAIDVLYENLYYHSYCTESVSVTALPIYHLEPNTFINLLDNNTGINGTYVMTRYTLPLAYNGTMSITANKAVQEIY